MKKIILGLLCVFTLMFIVTPKASARGYHKHNHDVPENAVLISSESKAARNGGYIVYDLYENVGDTASYGVATASTYARATTYAVTSTYTKTGTKTVTKYDSNSKILWRYVLSATFTVNEGVSATCTSASYTKTINNTFWKFSNGSTKKSGATANGKGKFTYKVLWLFSGETVTIDINLTCNQYGVLS